MEELRDPLYDMEVDEATQRYFVLLAAKSMAKRSNTDPERIYRMFAVTKEDVDNIEHFRHAANAARQEIWNHLNSHSGTPQGSPSPLP
jgi:hypothetical protein